MDYTTSDIMQMNLLLREKYGYIEFKEMFVKERERLESKYHTSLIGAIDIIISLFEKE